MTRYKSTLSLLTLLQVHLMQLGQWWNHKCSLCQTARACLSLAGGSKSRLRDEQCSLSIGCKLQILSRILHIVVQDQSRSWEMSLRSNFLHIWLFLAFLHILYFKVDQSRSSEMSTDSSARSPWTGVSQFLPTTQKLLQVAILLICKKSSIFVQSAWLL